VGVERLAEFERLMDLFEQGGVLGRQGAPTHRPHLGSRGRNLTLAYAWHRLSLVRPDSSLPHRYASLFRNGRNQAVRIPKEFEMEGDQVRISKDGARLILEPVVAPPRLTAVLAELGPIDDEFPDVDANLPPLDQPEL
jgi:antitoxin VapB